MSGARKFVRYETHVDALAEAWVFIMEHVDEFQSLNVEIESQLGTETGSLRFRAAVFGDVEGGW